MRGTSVKCLVAALGMALTSSAALAGSGGKIHPLEGLNPLDYGFSTNNPAAWFRGYEFTVQTDNLTVTQLGMRMPTAGQTVTLELWRANGQQRIAVVENVVTQENVWQYFSIAGVPLVNGERYTVGILAVTPNTRYFFKNALPPEWYPNGDIRYETMRFHNSATSQYPTSTLAGYHYGVADIGYVIPAPGALALLGLGAAVGTRRRRRA